MAEKTFETAVEWLESILNKNGFVTDEEIEQAKEMEKQQIINAFHRNSQKWFCEEEAEQYYKETFKTE
jgi:vacuolar-type H+-ATPase subunit H